MEKNVLQKLKTILEETQHLAKIGSWELDLQTNRLAWSRELFRIFDINPGSAELSSDGSFAASFNASTDACFDASYRIFLDRVHPEDKELVDRAYKASIENKTPYDITHRLLLDDGTIKYVHERCKTYYDANEGPVRSIGTAQDITLLKLAEAENKNLQTQYHQAQKMESIARLAGGVAHDFNNMLFVIMGNVELLLESMDLPGPAREIMEEIDGACRRSADLTRQLLAFARHQAISPVIVNLNHLVENLLKMLGRVIGEDIELTWLPAPDLGNVKMDPSQVEQILVNLCVNARDAIPGVGKITLETHNTEFSKAYCAEHLGFLTGAYVMLAVSDNGMGMDRKTMDRIFDPFFTTKEQGKGTGLGLATVYGIVKQNKGFINTYSENGTGTTFSIYFPRQESEIQAQGGEPDAPAPLGNNEYILLVEDEATILKTGRRMLERLGYRVKAVNRPAQALEVARQSPDRVDLLISDVIMPEMNGPDLAKSLEAILPDLKTLFVSGYTADVISRHGVLKKGGDFLQKPFSIYELAVKLNRMLS